MSEFLVISFDPGEHQSCRDHVLARDEHEARTWVQSVRGKYADVVDVFSVKLLRDSANLLDRVPEKDIRNDMIEFEQSEQI